jgi:hypothetical protein
MTVMGSMTVDVEWIAVRFLASCRRLPLLCVRAYPWDVARRGMPISAWPPLTSGEVASPDPAGVVVVRVASCALLAEDRSTSPGGLVLEQYLVSFRREAWGSALSLDRRIVGPEVENGDQDLKLPIGCSADQRARSMFDFLPINARHDVVARVRCFFFDHGHDLTMAHRNSAVPPPSSG